MRWVFALGLLLALLNLSTSLLLGAFNIQAFGEKKADNDKVMNIITEIVCRYDIILIQEVRNKDGRAVNELMNRVNRRSQYNHIVSAPLGPNSYKEQYLFLYRTPMVSVVDSDQYLDPGFTRPPFIVKFSSAVTAVKEFVLIPQHTRPEEAVAQMEALFDVVDGVRTIMRTNKIVLLGDFNAGGTYIKSKRWECIRNKPGFQWLISDAAGTSVRKSFPYDRIVVTDEMYMYVKPNTAGVYRYDQDLGLTEKEALEVSDHYPVEVQLT